MLRWFHAMMPKEERFFDLFAQHSRVVVAGAEALRAMLEGGDAIARNYQLVMDREQDADNVTREVLIAVRRSFITPFDRGNIRDLITSMDNSIDQMQKTAKSIMLFDLTTFTADMKNMADTIVKCARLMDEGVPAASLDSMPKQRGSARSPSNCPRLKARPTRCTTRGCANSIALTPAEMRLRSSPATRSTITWRRSSIASTTSPT